MSQDNQFQQYGYDQYLKAPKKQRLGDGSGFWSAVSEKLRSPVIATVALLAAGAVFTGVIIMAYPSAKNAPEEIPIIKADLTPIKSEPTEPGGMDVPYSDSTVLSSVGQDKPVDAVQDGKIENLLAQANEDLTSKEEALQRATGESQPAAEGTESEKIPQERGMFLQDEARKTAQAQGQQASADTKIASPDASALLQKIDPAAQGEEIAQDTISDDSAQKLADEAADATASGKPKMHAAATSPDTINYVRSVLNESDADKAKASKSSKSQPVAEIAASEEDEAGTAPEPLQDIAEPQAPKSKKASSEPSKLEPAAGAAMPAANIKSGDYYVQLASITDRNRADKEFAKLQKKFSALAGLEYRVKEANLNKGTFYRIQAGPFSKDSAKSICDSIKQQKPGGCILVK